ncbi:hypothetical protein BDY21DRAFT_365602 [Lineolata rhizophorae]|uniref:Uncharacterized protein n=1 Tax=Lineolata rhizophorae TaxID=578093 RepID=A0A6A6NUE8_9PEZI|nr:hypothetical protein BDY21DRAFT_365602 [Lineolata rhizophorae]
MSKNQEIQSFPEAEYSALRKAIYVTWNYISLFPEFGPATKVSLAENYNKNCRVLDGKYHKKVDVTAIEYCLEGSEDAPYGYKRFQNTAKGWTTVLRHDFMDLLLSAGYDKREIMFFSTKEAIADAIRAVQRIFQYLDGSDKITGSAIKCRARILAGMDVWEFSSREREETNHQVSRFLSGPPQVDWSHPTGFERRIVGFWKEALLESGRGNSFYKTTDREAVREAIENMYVHIHTWDCVLQEEFGLFGHYPAEKVKRRIECYALTYGFIGGPEPESRWKSIYHY